MIVCDKCLRPTDELVPAKVLTTAPCARCGETITPCIDPRTIDYVHVVAWEPEPSGASSETNSP